MSSNKNKGLLGEKRAIDYLCEKNYLILETNFRTKLGEIDIIAQKGDLIVFIEVKTRSSYDFGYPYEAVNNMKQQKIIKTAFIYIKQNKIKEKQFRFDIIEVYLNNGKVNHIENAFWT